MSTTDPYDSTPGYYSPSAGADSEASGYPDATETYPQLPPGPTASYEQPYGAGYQEPYNGAYRQPYDGAFQQPYNAGCQQPYPPFQAAYQDPNAAAYARAAAMGRYPKSKIAAGVMGLLIGWLGIHNFYLGHTGRGVAQLLISVLSCGALAWVSWIWSLIEGIMILTAVPGVPPWGVDADGVPLSN